MSEQTIHHTRIRPKGQITLPGKIRQLLDVKEGDDLIFRVEDDNRISIERAQLIPASQAWFWSERWQGMERAAQADIAAGKTQRFDSAGQALNFLHSAPESDDAAD